MEYRGRGRRRERWSNTGSMSAKQDQLQFSVSGAGKKEEEIKKEVNLSYLVKDFTWIIRKHWFIKTLSPSSR